MFRKDRKETMNMESKWSSEKPRGGGADFPLQAWGTTEWQFFIIQEML